MPDEEGFTSEAKRVLKSWRKLVIDWRKEFPNAKLPLAPQPLEYVLSSSNPDLMRCMTFGLCVWHSTIDDLMDLPMGDVYQNIICSDENGRLYGYIPLMASASPYQIGALNAESFCERVLRCAGHIITDGNTLLGDSKLEKMVILRMNRKFMKFMRQQHYRHVVEDALSRQFGMSVVDVKVAPA